MTIARSISRLACVSFVLFFDALPAVELEEVVVVTSRLRDAAIEDVPASVTVLQSDTIERAGLQHFGDILHLVPNLNWASATARPRYFQLRGIGELEQYQGAPNPSVGFLIDDIDFSGVGAPATTFDTEQVEVLRGPQGTAYGANALAGLISLRTREASFASTLRGEISGGSEDSYSGGLVVGGAVGDSEAAAYRLVAHHYASDGFRRNTFADRDDTDGRDETTLRGKLLWTPSEDLTAHLTAMYVDVDDGYDAFSIDNGFVTRSDRPGRDAQRSVAGAARFEYTGFDAFAVRSITTYAQSDILYSFDGDWGNDADWGIYAPYDFFSEFDRERRTVSQELRAISQLDQPFEWVAGVYALDTREINAQRDSASGAVFNALDATYEATNVALYAQTDFELTPRVSLTTGLRGERRDARYRDSNGERYTPAETMWGGHAGVVFEQSARRQWYLTASRGYKAGGFNIGASVPQARREFASESLWSLEAGTTWRAADDRSSWRGALFYMGREDQQVASSEQLVPGDPLSYVFYTDNAARGRNYGIEASGTWQVASALRLEATLGLLETEYLDYRVREVDLDGREQSHAPQYQYSLSAEYRHARDYVARVDLQGVDDFYFAADHSERAAAHTLVHLKLGYEAERWSAYAWARNLFDERYAQRGFYFGNEPPDFANERYVHWADRRQVGVTVTFNFE